MFAGNSLKPLPLLSGEGCSNLRPPCGDLLHSLLRRASSLIFSVSQRARWPYNQDGNSCHELENSPQRASHLFLPTTRPNFTALLLFIWLLLEQKLSNQGLQGKMSHFFVACDLFKIKILIYSTFKPQYKCQRSVPPEEDTKCMMHTAGTHQYRPLLSEEFCGFWVSNHVSCAKRMLPPSREECKPAVNLWGNWVAEISSQIFCRSIFESPPHLNCFQLAGKWPD